MERHISSSSAYDTTAMFASAEFGGQLTQIDGTPRRPSASSARSPMPLSRAGMAVSAPGAADDFDDLDESHMLTPRAEQEPRIRNRNSDVFSPMSEEPSPNVTPVGRQFANRGSEVFHNMSRQMQEDSPQLLTQFSFMELALTGQKLVRSKEYRKAAVVLESAVERGYHDLAALSVVHSQLGTCYSSIGEYEKAVKCHQADLDSARQLGDLPNVAKAFANIGNVFKTWGKYNEAILCYEQQLDVARLANDKAVQCRALSNLGGAYQAVSQAWRQKDDMQLCLEYCAQALKYTKQHARMAEHLKDKAAMGKAYGNLGILYEQLEDLDKATLCHKKRLKVAQEMGDKAAEGRAYCNLGNAYRAQKKYEKAIDCYERDLAIAQELQDEMGQAVTLSNLGNTHQAMGHIDPTIVCHRMHLDIVKRFSDKQAIAWAHGNLARVYELIGQYDDAIKHLEEEGHIARHLADPMLEKEVNQSIARIKNLRDSGATVDELSAVKALMAAQDASLSRSRSKSTVRGTMGRFLGASVGRLFSRKNRRSVSQAGTVSGDSIDLSDSYSFTRSSTSDRNSLSDMSMGSIKSTPSTSSSGVLQGGIPPSPNADKKLSAMPQRLANVFSRGEGAASAVSDVSFDDLEQGVLQQTDLNDSISGYSERIPEPLVRHRADAEQMLHDLGLFLEKEDRYRED